MTDKLWNLRDYGITACSYSTFVQSRGKPIIASTNCGLNGPPHRLWLMSAIFAFPSIP